MCKSYWSGHKTLFIKDVDTVLSDFKMSTYTELPFFFFSMLLYILRIWRKYVRVCCNCTCPSSCDCATNIGKNKRHFDLSGFFSEKDFFFLFHRKPELASDRMEVARCSWTTFFPHQISYLRVYFEEQLWESKNNDQRTWKGLKKGSLVLTIQKCEWCLK